MRRLSLLVVLFSFLFLFSASGYVISDNVVYDENGFVKLEVWPHTAKSPVLDFEQSFKVTNKKAQGGDLCVAYVFDDALSSADIWLEKEGIRQITRYNNTCWNESQEVNQTNATVTLCNSTVWYEDESYSYFDSVKDYFGHTIKNDKHVYYSNTPLTFDGYEAHKWKVRYKPESGSGKWDLFGWDTISGNCRNAFNNLSDRHFMGELDPWWNSSWGSCRDIGIVGGFPVNTTHLLKLNSSYINYSKTNADGSDLRIVKGSCSGGGDLVPLWIDVWNETNNSYVYFRTEDNTTSAYAMYYNNSLASSVSNGSSTFMYFEDCESWANDTVLVGNDGWTQGNTFNGVAINRFEADAAAVYRGSRGIYMADTGGEIYRYIGFNLSEGGLAVEGRMKASGTVGTYLGLYNGSTNWAYTTGVSVMADRTSTNTFHVWVNNVDDNTGLSSGNGVWYLSSLRFNKDGSGRFYLGNSLDDAVIGVGAINNTDNKIALGTYQQTNRFSYFDELRGFIYSNETTFTISEENLLPYPPSIVNITVSPALIYTDTDVVFNITVTDENGDNVTTFYNITYSNGTNILSGNGSDNFSVVLGSGNFSKGQRINITAYPQDDGGLNGSSFNASFVVLNTLPNITNINYTPSDVYNFTDMIWYVWVFDLDGDSVTSFYNITLANGSSVGSGNGSDNFSVVLSSGYYEVDDVLTFVAYPFDGDENGTTRNESVTIIGLPTTTTGTVDNTPIAVLIFLPILFGFMLLVMGGFLDTKEHPALKLFLMLLAFTTFFVSLHFGLTAVSEIYDYDSLENLVGSTNYWVSVVFMVILTYFLIYIFYKGVYISAQEKKESRWNY